MKVECKYDELVNVENLTPHPQNRNEHPKDQIKRLADILKYQGWRVPIRVSKRSGFITAGHGRLEAALLNKWEQVPVVFQSYDTADQEYSDLVSDNSIASWADLNLAGINSDIGDLGPDFNIEMLGLKNFEIEPADKITEKEIDENISTDTECPSCGYKWQANRS